MNEGNKCDKLSSLKEVLNTDEYNLDKMSILDKLCELFDVDETITEDNNELKQSVDCENDTLLQKKWSNKGLKRSRSEENIETLEAITMVSNDLSLLVLGLELGRNKWKRPDQWSVFH